MVPRVHLSARVVCHRTPASFRFTVRLGMFKVLFSFAMVSQHAQKFTQFSGLWYLYKGSFGFTRGIRRSCFIRGSSTCPDLCFCLSFRTVSKGMFACVLAVKL